MNIEYGVANLRSFQITTEEEEKNKRKVVSAVSIDGRQLRPSNRFWTSLFARFGISSNIFQFFDHKEVFERISTRANDDLRYVIQGDGEDEVLLAVSGPEKPLVQYDQIMELATAQGSEGITYADGIVKTQHSPRGGRGQVINGDQFSNKFVMDVPIDGYGKPSIYLMLLRMVCSNGAIALAPAFRSEVNIGNRNQTDGNVNYSLTRALDQFNSEEGYAALRDRFEAAALSWVSVNESQQLYKTLVATAHNGGFAIEKNGALRHSDSSVVINGLLANDSEMSILDAFHRLTGDVNRTYGLANLDALSPKKARQLPVNASMYDLINFVTELSTHYATPTGARRLNSWVGTLLSNEFDMEGTKAKYGQFADFHVAA